MVWNPDWDGYREDQRRLHSLIIRDVRAGEKEIGVHLHIRGGKSMLIRMCAVDLAELKFASISMAINNRAELRRQLTKAERWKEDFTRLKTLPARTEPFGYAHVKRKNNGEEAG